jgi:hypothetical protein
VSGRRSDQISNTLLAELSIAECDVQHTHAKGPAANIISHLGRGNSVVSRLLCFSSGRRHRTVTSDRNQATFFPSSPPAPSQATKLCVTPRAAPSLPLSSSPPARSPQVSHARTEWASYLLCFPFRIENVSRLVAHQRSSACCGGRRPGEGRDGSLRLPCFGRLVTETERKETLFYSHGR